MSLSPSTNNGSIIFPPITDGKIAQSPLSEYRGKHVILERIQPRHAESLWRNVQQDASLWEYMRQSPYSTEQGYREYIEQISTRGNSYEYAILFSNNPEEAVGQIAIQRHDMANRSNEIGGVLLSKKIQKTTAATEVYYLLMKASFEQMNSRRLEWKTNTLHTPSIKAALRLGFTFEGVFRNYLIVKGCSRDVAWYSIIDNEWPAKKKILETWLSDDNFDERSRQRKSLAEIASTTS